MGKAKEHSQPSPPDVTDLWEHACLLYHSFEWQSAANAFQCLEDLVSDNGDKCILAMNKGLIEARLGDLVFALVSFTRALAYEQDNAVVHFLLGLVYAETGDYVKGQVHFGNCLESINVYAQDHKNHVGSFDLNRTIVQDNSDKLRSALKAMSAGQDRLISLQMRLNMVPANVLFEAPPRPTSTYTPRPGDQQCADLELSSKSRADHGEHVRNLETDAVEQTDVTSFIEDSLHHSEGEDPRPMAEPSVDILEGGKKHLRLSPRDPQLRDPSTLELAQFLRNAGPGTSANVSIDRKYLQHLLQTNDRAPFVVSSLTSTTVGMPQLPDLVNCEGDYESLLGLYTGASTTRPSSSATIRRSTADTITANPRSSAEHTTGDGADTVVASDAVPSQSRRPTLEAAQRWLRKDIHSPWPKKTTASKQKTNLQTARDGSRDNLLYKEPDAQSLPSVVCSLDMFKFGKSRKPTSYSVAEIV